MSVVVRGKEEMDVAAEATRDCGFCDDGFRTAGMGAVCYPDGTVMCAWAVTAVRLYRRRMAAWRKRRADKGKGK